MAPVPWGTDEQLEWVCRSVLTAKSSLFRGADVRACFYPYIGLTHTIRRRGSGWHLRVSDHCRDASRAVLEAIATILACKILRRRPPASSLELYREYATDPEIRERVARRRLRRGFKRLAPAHGRTHSLEAIFDEINRRYFSDQVQVRGLGWGMRRGWSRLGHYDPVHQTITVSPVLDTPKVPRSIVAYIVYHEMLHTLFGEKERSGKREHHPPAFRRAEQAYPDYREAREFLERFCRRRGRY